jgi:hypothetical protein
MQAAVPRCASLPSLALLLSAIDGKERHAPDYSGAFLEVYMA